MEKVAFGILKLECLQNRARLDHYSPIHMIKLKYLGPTGIRIRSPIRTFNWCENQRPWVTLKGHYSVHSVSKRMHLSELTRNLESGLIDLYSTFSDEDAIQMTNVSFGN